MRIILSGPIRLGRRLGFDVVLSLSLDGSGGGGGVSSNQTHPLWTTARQRDDKRASQSQCLSGLFRRSASLPATLTAS